MDKYLQRVVIRCREWFDAHGATLFLQIEGSDTFLLAAQEGIDSALPWSASFGKGESIAGTVAATGKPLLIQDPHLHPALRAKGVSPRQDLSSAIIAPLETPQNGCIGVLNLSRKAGAAPFRQSDVRKVVSLARVIALAVDHARLIAKLNASITKHRALAAQTSGILNSLKAGVIALDSGGRVVQANSEALKRLQAGKNPAIGMRWDRLFRSLPAGARGAAERCVTSASEGGRRSETADTGKTGHLRILASPSATGGVTLVIDDVTDEVERERELARVKRLAEIGQMTAAVAHEIRNPLTSIRSAAQMIQSEQKLADARSWAKLIEEEALTLNSLCDEFLELAGPLKIEPQAADIVALIERLLSIHQPEFEQRRISITFRNSLRKPIIHVDEKRLAQAIRNLLRNAMDAMPKGGELQVETSARKGLVRITVTDDGIGIPEKEMTNLFTAFYTTKPSGAGLGLCNVRRIVEAHGGRVFASSKPGNGSNFTIELPDKQKGAGR